jgi:signal transduction histidine kinase
MGSDTSLSAQISRSNLLRYSLSGAALLVAVSACVGLSFLGADRFCSTILFTAVAFSAWYCGVAPAIVTTVLALFAIAYGFHPRIHALHTPTTGDLVGLLAFLVLSALIILMGELRRRENAALWYAQEELELKVQERTADLDNVNRNLRDLSARLMQLQDDERRRIARELHDSVGQTLAALSMNLTTVRTDIEQLARTAIALNDSEGLVREMVTEVRTISHLLHPPLLDELGLASALRWYVGGFSQRSNIKVDLDMAEDFARLPAEMETAVFRVVQECLTNIHRHSGSPVARIRVRERDGHCQVDIEDKGKGIPQKKLEEMASAGTPGVGIRGMQERIRQLGGTMEISSDSSGTVVTVRLPVGRVSEETEIPAEDPSPQAAA